MCSFNPQSWSHSCSCSASHSLSVTLASYKLIICIQQYMHLSHHLLPLHTPQHFTCNMVLLTDDFRIMIISNLAQITDWCIVIWFTSRTNLLNEWWYFGFSGPTYACGPLFILASWVERDIWSWLLFKHYQTNINNNCIDILKSWRQQLKGKLNIPEVTYVIQMIHWLWAYSALFQFQGSAILALSGFSALTP